MKIEPYTTDDGWPGVRWRQEVPTGESWYSWGRRVQIAVGVILGLLLAYGLLSSGISVGWSLLWGGVLGFAVTAPEAFSRMGAVLEGKGSSGGGKSEWERSLVSSWKARPILVSEDIHTEVTYHKMNGFTFWWARGTHVDHFPLLSFDRFELGTAQEWFGDVAARELQQLEHRPASWVIVAAVQGRGVVKIAESGRDKAGISNLLLALSAAFVDNRKALSAKVE